MQLWNRTELIDEPEVGLGAIKFAYGTTLGRFLAKTILCRKFVSNIYGWWQRSRFSKKKVQKFMKQYGITTDDCVKSEFSCFDDFFTRQRKPEPILTAENELAAIADSKLLALPIDERSVFSIKGVPYTTAELLENEALAKEFDGGMCLIFRLAPTDYHRYAYADDAEQSPSVKIPGVLHTVNPIAGTMKVFRRNTRQYNLLRTKHFGTMLQMEVGALLVGRICNHNDKRSSVKKLEEKGFFRYGGSTVILLAQKERVRIDADILEHSAKGIETKVRLGDRIGKAL
ncbi:MAG: phosphatidylserine decarboxylase [Ruminococcaceae bacterium]|nr:phosphatidylserine decarboxylase [Oscillospiraceae bacterium]